MFPHCKHIFNVLHYPQDQSIDKTITTFKMAQKPFQWTLENSVLHSCTIPSLSFLYSKTRIHCQDSHWKQTLINHYLLSSPLIISFNTHCLHLSPLNELNKITFILLGLNIIQSQRRRIISSLAYFSLLGEYFENQATYFSSLYFPGCSTQSMFTK